MILILAAGHSYREATRQGPTDGTTHRSLVFQNSTRCHLSGKFFAFDVTVRRRGSVLRGIGAHGKALVALLSIPLILAHPLG